MATSANRFVHRPNAIDRLGRTVVYAGELLRHPVYTRFLHWMVGIFFFLALLSGFGIYLPWIFRFFTPLFGGGAMTRFLHPWFGLAFVFFFALQTINWLGVMRWTAADSRWMKRIKSYVANEEAVEPKDVGFFNAGQKMQFWEIVCGSIAFVITGVIMWFPEIFGRILVAISYVVHDISALIMLFGIFFHIYLSTFGEPGTIQAMTRGTVSEAWAWTHHPAWSQEVTGRDPYEAIDEARKQMDVRERESGPDSDRLSSL
jgi:formate dehydrogenase subunit gamma